MDLAKNILAFFNTNPSAAVAMVAFIVIALIMRAKSIFKFFARTTPGVHGKNKDTTQNNASDTKGDLEQFRDKVTHNYGIQDTKQLEAKIDILIAAEAQARADKEAYPQKALADKQGVDEGVRANLKAIEAYIPNLNTGDALEKLENNDRSGAIEIFTKLEKEGISLAAEAAYNLGKIAYDDIRWPDALEHFKRALVLDSENEAYMDKVGELYWQLGNFKNALPFYLKSLNLTEVEFNNHDHEKLALKYNDLATIYFQLGRLKEALPLYEKAILIREKLNPKRDTEELATSYDNLSVFYFSLNDYQKALALSLKSLKIKEALDIDQRNKIIALSYNNLATLYNHMGEFLEAEKYHKKAISNIILALPKSHPNRIFVINNYVMFLNQQGRTAEANALRQEHEL